MWLVGEKRPLGMNLKLAFTLKMKSLLHVGNDLAKKYLKDFDCNVITTLERV